MATPAAIWQAAQLPDYTNNVNQYYFYSTTPDFTDPAYGFHCEQIQGTVNIVDYFGQGRITNGSTVTGFPSAYNVNEQWAVIGSGASAKRIPNRIPIVFQQNNYFSTTAYLANRSVTYVTITQPSTTPVITDAVAVDMTRVVNSTGNGFIIVYGIQPTDAQITRLKSYMPFTMAQNTLWTTIAPFTQITASPMIVFSSTAAIVSAVTGAIAAGNWTLIGQQIADLYLASKTQVLPSIVTQVLNASEGRYIFVIMVAACSAIKSGNGAYTNFLRDYNVSNSTMRGIIGAGTDSSTVYLNNVNSNNAGPFRNVTLNATGQAVDSHYNVVTDPGGLKVRTEAMYPIVSGSGLQMKFRTGTVADPVDLYLNGTGELWSGGPSYYVWANTLAAGGTLQWYVRPNGNNGVYFYVITPFGESYLNGLGDDWSKGPSWYCTVEGLNSRTGGAYNWS